MSDPLATTVRRAVWADWWTRLSALTVLLMIGLALAADLLVSLEGQSLRPDTSVLGPTGLPAEGPSADHWFGVEPLTGIDLFALVVHGARTSLLIGLAATVVAVLLGLLIGASAGYLGGWWDRIVGWTTDVIFGFPYLIFLIALSAVTPPSVPKPLLLVIVLGFFGWPRIARVVRAQTLTLTQRKFVAAARVMGAGPWHVFRTELLPNLWAPVIVVSTLSIPSMIGLEAALSFLGVGIQPPTASWGRTISTAIDYVEVDPLYLIFPGAALFLVTLGFNVVGDSVRDAIDPRSAGRI
ncbi:ABC transporter permease [Pseudonocardiaceae bacterium YIM PH 21723]|nr:ABC transporter permease [Pseudonocardiaceae bacterium YIM PH 21723]